MPRRIHAILRERRDDIVRAWQALARQDPGAAPGGLALRDAVVPLLDALATYLEGEGAPGPPREPADVLARALDRIDAAVDLAEVLREYRLLREAILVEALAAEGIRRGPRAQASARLGEVARLEAGLDLALSGSVERALRERDRSAAAAQEAVRENEARLRALVEPWAQAYWETDAAGSVVADSPSWRAYTGQSLAEWLGAGWLDAIHPDDRAYAARRWRECVAARRPVDAEFRLRRAGGGWRWTNVHASPIVGPAGDVVKWVGINVDITERKAAEEELRRADRQKADFLAALSHELRNPLAPIRSSLYVLEHAPAGSEPAARAREALARQAAHLARLVDDLLDVTRISRGKIALDRARVDVREVVWRTVDDLRPSFDERGLELRVEDTAASSCVVGDAVRLAQVLSNLLQNAAKFTPPGGSVTVALSSAGRELTVAVQDTGEGMAPAEIERMFEPFAQAAETLARRRGGLGLGLALVRGFVQLHGGRVRATSAGHGEGTEVVVTLPLAPPAPARAVPPPGAGSPPPPGRDIVVIEDNVDAAQTLADALALQGHRVRVAHDGRTGIAFVRERPPDVVLCDIGLPDISGYEIATTLRADASLRGVRIVALTGYAQPEDRQRASGAGFDAHLAKPPSFERLAEVLGDGAAGGRDEPAPAGADQRS